METNLQQINLEKLLYSPNFAETDPKLGCWLYYISTIQYKASFAPSTDKTKLIVQ